MTVSAQLRALPDLRLCARTMALLLLLAWAPTLFFVDHWPAPALLGAGSVAHDHALHEAAAGQAHVEHGHGGAADGVAGTAVTTPVPIFVSFDAPLVAQPEAGEAMRALASQTPEAPPPR